MPCGALGSPNRNLQITFGHVAHHINLLGGSQELRSGRQKGPPYEASAYTASHEREKEYICHVLITWSRVPNVDAYWAYLPFDLSTFRESDRNITYFVSNHT